MIKKTLLLLLMPTVLWANEPAHQAETKPIKAAESHAPAGAEKPAEKSRHAVPQQMSTPIKIAQPEGGHAAEPAAAEVMPVKPPPVVRYVAPQYGSASVYRPVVRSKAPSSHGSAKSKTHAKSSAHVKSYTATPGFVRVLPASQMPSYAILPPAKGMSSATKNRPAWGQDAEATKVPEPEMPVAGRKLASPQFYTEKNSEQRWQYYSYP
ncbi:hypothetical protein [Deefgea salmonis]|uniref:Uncharacterized protein n=1 Tax=Deefgea salmonis TaxID=2875502 RepID=A0ABS8BJ17_9NEIS|nr:hypothetical protein [Deefgea salmonis]MCB5195531.1 hypothetical protein [Deefgea salmonis]